MKHLQDKKALFIPGLPRCATTSLVNVIGQRNEIGVGIQKEPHYFIPAKDKEKIYSFDGRKKTPFQKLGFCETESSYIANYKMLVNEEYFVDASTLYSAYPESIKEIAKYFNAPKFVILYRSALSRAYSHYLFSKSRGEEYRDFQSALNEEVEGVTSEWLLKGYFAGSRLTPLVNEINEIFGKESFLIIDIEKSDLYSKEVLSAIESFLDLDSIDYDFAIYENGSTSLSNPLLRWIRKVLKKIRQLNPELIDNKVTRKLFNFFMSISPKAKKNNSELSSVSYETKKLFKDLDDENRELLQKYASRVVC
ncbi:hypothetical protein OW491_14785 [Neptunomonas sp. CHC150]|uniref:hypothetical protein n=1 Tax=Neptunomonas sp. CHC150 TaxID=2998324 RepID=UPI0025B13BDE|nr:hypothetical protein [Neptunomonas sp. CHC150]MDN2661074.1 hypothetical protein [Neptunomonas sp. CHC150]